MRPGIALTVCVSLSGKISSYSKAVIWATGFPVKVERHDLTDHLRRTRRAV